MNGTLVPQSLGIMRLPGDSRHVSRRHGRQETDYRAIGAVDRVSNVNPHNRRRIRPGRRRRSDRSLAHRFRARRQLLGRTRTNLNAKRAKVHERGRHRRHVCNDRGRLASRLTLGHRSLTLLLAGLHRVVGGAGRSRQRRNGRRRRHEPQQDLAPHSRTMRHQQTPTRRGHRVSSRTARHEHTALS